MDQDHDIITQLLSRPDTRPGTFLGPPMTHYTLLLWRRSEPGIICQHLFCSAAKTISDFHLMEIWWWSTLHFTLPPWSNDGTKYLFIQIDDYEWAILSRLSSRPWYIIVIFCGNPPKIHRHGTLAKTTKYSSSENIGLARHTKQIVIKWPKKAPRHQIVGVFPSPGGLNIVSAVWAGTATCN